MLNIVVYVLSNSRVLGASSLLLVFSYPLMKRLTFWVILLSIGFCQWYSSFLLMKISGSLTDFTIY